MDKPLVLFYSKYCAFSREVRDAAFQSPLKHKMVQICVDDKAKNTLPTVVKRVPTMIDRQSGDVFVGESIMGLINHLSGGAGQNRDSAARQQPMMQQPMMQQPMMQQREMPNRLPAMSSESAPFQSVPTGGPAALNEDNGPYALMAGQAADTLELSYAPLSGAIESAGNDFSSKTGKGDGIESKYEELMAQRNMEGKGPRMM